MLAWMIFRNYLLSRRSGALVRIIAWHCILGVGMGVAALIIVLSVMNGFNLAIRGKMLSVEPHLILPMTAMPTEARRLEVEKIVRDAAPSGVESVVRFESQDLILRSAEGAFGGVTAKGYDTKTLEQMIDRMWRANRKEMTPPPEEESATLAKNEIILGVDLAGNLNVFEGDEVTLIPPETLLLPKGEVPRLRKFKVKSLISTQMPELDLKILFYNLDAFPEKLRSASRERGFEVRLVNAYEADQVKTALESKKIASQTWGERDTSLFFALKMESYAMTLFLSLAVFITSFSIVIVMVLLLSQKRQDIGMMMSLGLSMRQARLVFLKVGLMLSGVGIGGGILIGTAVSTFLDWHPLDLLPDIYTDSTLPAKLSFRIFIFVVISSGLIAVIGSWLPVWRYVLANPSESLRRRGFGET